MSLKITIETPEPNDKPNETFEIEIGSNQRLKILHQTILSQVKNLELRDMFKKDILLIYENARTYNAKDTIFYKFADIL